MTLTSVAAAEAPPTPPLVCEAPTPATFSGSTGPIPDNDLVTFEVVVSGQPERIWDVDLGIELPHSFPNDLELKLTSPAGTSVVITRINGGPNDNVFDGTLFDDQASPGGVAPYDKRPAS